MKKLFICATAILCAMVSSCSVDDSDQPGGQSAHITAEGGIGGQGGGVPVPPPPPPPPPGP